MLRLAFSFCLALLVHFYLMRCHLDLNNHTDPQLVSDSSVTITLDQINTKKSINTPADVSMLKQNRKQNIIEKITEPKVSQPVQEIVPSSSPQKFIKKQQLKVERETVKKTDIQPRKQKQVREAREDTQNAHTIDNPISHNAPSKLPRETAISNNNRQASEPTSSSVIKARPLYQYNPKPYYPDLARRRDWQGVVTLLVDVSKEGNCVSILLQKSSGYELLDKSALKAVKKWRFIPGKIDGKPVASRVVVPVHFVLHKE